MTPFPLIRRSLFGLACSSMPFQNRWLLVLWLPVLVTSSYVSLSSFCCCTCSAPTPMRTYSNPICCSTLTRRKCQKSADLHCRCISLQFSGGVRLLKLRAATFLHLMQIGSNSMPTSTTTTQTKQKRKTGYVLRRHDACIRDASSWHHGTVDHYVNRHRHWGSYRRGYDYVVSKFSRCLLTHNFHV